MNQATGSKGVVLEKVYAAVCRENYASILNEIAPPKIEDVVSGLENHFFALQKKGEDLSQCDVCHGWSAESVTKACPFCNDGRYEQAPKQAPPMPQSSSPIVAEIVPADAAAAMTSRVKKREASAPKLSLLSGGRTQLTEKDLDDEIAAMERDANSAASGAYSVGRRLIRIHDELWMLRPGKDGKQKYKSYSQFVEEELHIHVGYANKIRRVAEAFTKEQYLEFGIEALKAIVASPKEMHDDLLKRRAAGATVPELEQTVREIKEKGGITVVETAATSDEAREAAKGKKSIPTKEAVEAAAAARRKPKPEASAFTIGLKTDKAFEVPCFARPKKGSEPTRARSMDDQPYGEIEGINGRKLYVVVKQTPAGEWFFKVTPKKPDDGEE